MSTRPIYDKNTENLHQYIRANDLETLNAHWHLGKTKFVQTMTASTLALFVARSTLVCYAFYGNMLKQSIIQKVQGHSMTFVQDHLDSVVRQHKEHLFGFNSAD